MDRVKIYSKYDLTTNMNINNIINFTNNFNYEIEEYNINDVSAIRHRELYPLQIITVRDRL